jgi:DNA-binding winged helix-turn-helix (wHTH) protein
MSPPAFWSFPPFRLDPVTSRLWRDDVLIPRPPKPLAVLAILVAQAGQVVTKEALLDAVWPETAVTESVLKGCIRQIRRALSETAGTAQYVATVHRRGYRFLASVTLRAASSVLKGAILPGCNASGMIRNGRAHHRTNSREVMPSRSPFFAQCRICYNLTTNLECLVSFGD